MKRLTQILTTSALLCALLPAAASAQFGLQGMEVTFTGPDGGTSLPAGSHPFAMTTTFDVNTVEEGGKAYADGAIRDFEVQLPPGFAGSPTAVPRCADVDFLTTLVEGAAIDSYFDLKKCADSTMVGTVRVAVANSDDIEEAKEVARPVPVYNLTPPPGVAAKLGFWVNQVPVTVLMTVNPEPPYNVIASIRNTSQTLEVAFSEVTIWGNPADPAHDGKRGVCLGIGGTCPANIPVEPFITMPRACTGPLQTIFRAKPWWEGSPLDPIVPGTPFEGAASSSPTTFCGSLGFAPTIEAKPTTLAAQSPSGLDFSLNVKDEGLTNPTGRAHSDIKRVEATLPEGFSTNPSMAEGLNVCSEADLARETAFSDPGAGCPNASKIGTVEVETPLLEEQVNGSLFIAKPHENPFGSLLALYLVIKNANLGIVVKQPMKVVPDPRTGRLTTIADNLPQLPFSSFKLHFREGTRSPLASPPACGRYEVKALLTPWSGGAPVTSTSDFQIITGPGGGPCPSGGLPPFRPGLVAGTLNNAAGHYSPFNVRLFRSDAEQEITRFSIKLPPGLVGKLAGIPFCSDAAVEAAKLKSGAAEEASPSCPASSQIGRTLVGAGVGPTLAYAPGKVYLSGPYNGSAISLVAITAAKVGPFDLGTVVVREAFKIDPETAEVFIDATGSDPIPHIIDGIPVHLRDIRVYADRPEFVLNPTGCKRTSTASTLLGAGLDFASEADNNPVVVSTPFQAADCAALGFKPKLDLRLLGGTKRGAHPRLKATLTMRPGESAIARTQVTLPRSEFLDNAHIKTICTRVQFRANQCPEGSVYGFAKATTPILDEPLSGPVYLRSSEHKLPDLVAKLANGKIEVHLVGRVDSVGGGIRNTFDVVPDAPVSSFTLEMQGGKKGLLINSTNICRGRHRAKASFTAHNGKRKDLQPELKAKCKGKGKGSKRRHRAG